MTAFVCFTNLATKVIVHLIAKSDRRIVHGKFGLMIIELMFAHEYHLPNTKTILNY